jgi:hypothetical protein
MATLDLFGNMLPDDFSRSITGGSPVARDTRKALNALGKLVTVPRGGHAMPDAPPRAPDFIGPLDHSTVRRLHPDATTDQGFVTKARKDCVLDRRNGGAITGAAKQAELSMREPDRMRQGLVQMMTGKRNQFTAPVRPRAHASMGGCK